MWKLSLRTHCAEETLLALLDGELPAAEERTARQHLRRCWRCRTRAAEIESALASVSRLFDHDAVTPADKEDARRRLQIRCASLEESAAAPSARRKPRAWIPRIGFAAALVLSVVSLGAWLHSVNQRAATERPKPLERSPRPRVEPERKPAFTARTQPAPLPALEPAPLPPLGKSAAPGPDLDSAEVQAHYALHRVGACLGEPVEVVRPAAGELLVRGVVDSVERRDRLVEELRLVPHLRTAIHTVAEAMAEIPATTVEEQAEPVVRQDRSLVDSQLRRYVESGLGLKGDAARTAVVQLSQEAVRSADATLAESWALRRLARSFHNQGNLKVADQQLLFLMVHDHCAALYQRLAAHSDVLSPALTWLAGERAVAAAAQPIDQSWSTWIEASFAYLERLHALTLGLFSSTGQDLEPAEGAAELLQVMATIEGQSKQIEASARQPESARAAALADRN